MYIHTTTQQNKYIHKNASINTLKMRKWGEAGTRQGMGMGWDIWGFGTVKTLS